VLVNVDADVVLSIIRDYGLTSVPTLKLFRRGVAVATRHGYPSEAALRKRLDQYMARASDLALADAVDLYARGQQRAAYETSIEAVAADPDNPRLPLTLCKLLRREQSYAVALKVIYALPTARQQLVAHYVGRQEYVAALEQLGAIIDQEPEFDQGYARQAIPSVFNLLGEDHPLISQYRGHLRRYAHQAGWPGGHAMAQDKHRIH